MRKTENIKLDLAKFQNNYRVIAKVDGKKFSYATKNETRAKNVYDFAKKVVSAADETGDTPIFDTGKTADGDYMIMASIDGVEHYLNVETQISAYEILNFFCHLFFVKFLGDPF